MDNGVTFYEETHDVGEVIYKGLRYRVFFDAQRRSTGSVLVPGQETGDTTPPVVLH